jgi:hypothetical protein
MYIIWILSGRFVAVSVFIILAESVSSFSSSRIRFPTSIRRRRTTGSRRGRRGVKRSHKLIA